MFQFRPRDLSEEREKVVGVEGTAKRYQFEEKTTEAPHVRLSRVRDVWRKMTGESDL